MRAQTIAGLRYQQNDPGVMATRRFFAEGFAGHPYGQPTSGTIDSVETITRDDIVAMHRSVIARGRAKIAVVGAIDAERLSHLSRQGLRRPRRADAAEARSGDDARRAAARASSSISTCRNR